MGISVREMPKAIQNIQTLYRPVLVGERRITWAPFKVSHWLQILVQMSIFTYWGLYYKEVWPHFEQILYQLVFAYMLQGLITRIQKASWELSFGLVPLVLSVNLFVWFDSTNYGGFVPIALGVASKHLIRRNNRHIMNPSGFGVAMMGWLIILTDLFLPGGSPFRYIEISHVLNLPPNMAELVLLVGLLPLVLFSLGYITIPAAFILFLLDGTASNFGFTPIWAPILIAILLFITDPATTPKTPGGKVLYGICAGILIHLSGGIAFTLTSMSGLAPGSDFWGKVLCIPLLNWMVPIFDKASSRLNLGFGSPNFAKQQIVVWLILMVGMLFLVKKDLVKSHEHLQNETIFIQVNQAGAVTCEENRMFCEPFSIMEELGYWIRHFQEEGTKRELMGSEDLM
jgi:hypothetical protein